ncbi:uncharacterized protein BJ212DRAFT_1448197 [Suillus subaureus]|uniref:Uncharacterized protein n=1 Tax=Suillus subaureus TaxID=48587 RepID=A0A9P7JB39_9AGAM|nr:uncharacterized protein BJ212DRAFT_1448197 [Suillus subaureus]KAG1812062.1 hypothetical protein BJ212DRAFT_1448197 [Suillus subaureus]
MRSQHEPQNFLLPHHSSSSSSSSPPPTSCKRSLSSVSQSGPGHPLSDTTYHSHSQSRLEGASDSCTQASGGHDFEHDAPYNAFEDWHSAEPPADSTGGLDVDQPPGSSASSDSQAQSQPQVTRTYYPIINGRICNDQGNPIPLYAPPPPHPSDHGSDDWTPYNDHVKFEVTDFLHRCNQMSAGNINFVFNLWAASLAAHGDTPPFTNHTDMYDTINSTPLGSLQYNGILPDNSDDVSSWMKSEYDIHMDEFNYALVQEYSVSDGAHQFHDFMSSDWCWKQADLIVQDPDTIGAMFIPIILGSDKMTVSVTTGHNQYWPVYMSIGNIHNNVQCTHCNGIVLLGFLAIPKTDNEATKDAHFRKFCCQLLHSSLAKMLETLKPGMTKLEVQALLACIVQNWCSKCTTPADSLNDTYGGHSHDHTKVLVEEFKLGVLWDEYSLVGDIVPFTNYFPCADIHKLLSPDILHQLIKGAFKDHLVQWVHDYIEAQYTEANVNRILDDIDHQGFKQWTGDDSKALMKVYIPAIEGHIPTEMVQTLQALLNFIYITHHNIISSSSLNTMNDTLKHFHRYCKIFQTSSVWPKGFNHPQQHSLIHYHKLIQAFSTPNGLCSSITDCFKALSQMLLTNQHLDKLATSCCNADEDEGKTNAEPDADAVDGPMVLAHVDLAKTAAKQIYPELIADQIGQPNFTTLIQHFLHSDSSRSALPEIYEKITLYTSAMATFFAPSDLSGISNTWRNGPGHYDCIFHDGIMYPCALVQWFKCVADSPDELMGMWVHTVSVIHLDSIFCAAHLIPVFWGDFVPTNLTYSQTLNAFCTYYVNNFIDHHAYEITF